MGKPIASVAGGRQSVLLGLGVHRPERVVTNDEICETIDSTDEWIQTRTGIKSRRFAGDGEGVVAMSLGAARGALAASGIAPEQIGAVIIATSTYDLQTPQAASVIAHELGMNGPAAFDLAAGCAGFSTALGVANDLIRGGTADYALVVGVDRMSDTTEPTDRSVRFIFGDGAGAVIVGVSDTVESAPSSGVRTEASPTPSSRSRAGSSSSRSPKALARGSRWPARPYSVGLLSKWARLPRAHSKSRV